MRIIELEITNYRPFNETTKFQFKKNFTVIGGVNGRGKTAILEGIALILSRLLPLISPAKGGYKKVVETDVNGNHKEFKISVKLNCANIPLTYSLDYDKDNSINKIKTTELTSAVRDEIKKAYGNPNKADDQSPLVVYYTTDRAGYRFPKAMPKVMSCKQSLAYNGALFNRTVDYKDFIARYRVAASQSNDAETDNYKENGFSANVIEAINKTIKTFLDGFSNLHVSENPLTLLIEKNGETIDIRQLSDGERSFIALICDLGRRLALANPELKNPLYGAGIVLIDEIELHLHPKWQLEVSEKLRKIFPNIQFIVTTHSPFIIQTARQGEVIMLGGDLLIDPYGKSLEEVARYVMDIHDTEYSPRIKEMGETAKKYLSLVDESKTASQDRKDEIQKQIIKLLAPFTDNPAYTALLESKGLL
jgi:predicted ATP-binding protein involved in virulence